MHTGIYIEVLNMNKEQINKQVKTELEYIPRDRKGGINNILREYYTSLREVNLGKNAKNSATKEDILRQSIELVKKDFPGFVQKYDETFFKLKVTK